MSKAKVSKQLVSNIDFSAQPHAKNEYEYCEFVNCTFNDLSNLSLIDCDFTNCNLSNAKTVKAGLQNCRFKDCKLLGVDFSGSKNFTFEVHFENCVMDYTFFDKKEMNKSSFKHCRLHGANFTQTDLSRCSVTHCDFYEAVFSGTNLMGLDFTSNVNFIIDPEANNIKKARFALQSLPGLLQAYQIVVE